MLFTAPSTALRLRNLALLVFTCALICLPFADLSVVATDPARMLSALLSGMIQPNFSALEAPWQALGYTVSFALLGVSIGVTAGFGLALLFRFRSVRTLCAATRAVHELFWALLLMQVFGLSTLTGLLAIALPYAATFAKVYAEILQLADPQPKRHLSPSSGAISSFFYAQLPLVWQELRSYTRYRFECGLRSSAILGFIGLPTLGFHLETAFKQANYDQGMALLLIFFALIGTIRWWARPPLLPLYLIAALIWLPADTRVNPTLIWQFISHDIWPSALQRGDLAGLLRWGQQLLELAAPAVLDTLLLSQMALALTLLLVLAGFWLGSAHFVPRQALPIGHALLLVSRSTPEMLLAFILLMLLGPSMLPAVIALALHNGGLIAYLIARASEQLPALQLRCRAIERYSYQAVPQLLPQLLSFLFYRWEVIMRESAILGVLGVASLGFYIDSAFEMLRFDRAFALILISALLNIAVDALARRLRMQTGLDRIRSYQDR